jgi:undecaprenyl-diphosphatase
MDPNQRLFDAINGFARDTSWLHAPTVAYAKYGIVLFAVLILTAIWQARHDTHAALAAALWAGIGTLVAVAVNQPIVALVAERRPYMNNPGALTLIARTTDWSFPSDHAVMAGACTVGLLIASWRLGVVSAVAAVLLAATRLYVGAHYPGDVLAGLVLGGLVAGVGWLALRTPLTNLTARLRGIPVIQNWAAPEPESPQPSS